MFTLELKDAKCRNKYWYICNTDSAEVTDYNNPQFDFIEQSPISVGHEGYTFKLYVCTITSATLKGIFGDEMGVNAISYEIGSGLEQSQVEIMEILYF